MVAEVYDQKDKAKREPGERVVQMVVGDFERGFQRLGVSEARGRLQDQPALERDTAELRDGGAVADEERVFGGFIKHLLKNKKMILPN